MMQWTSLLSLFFLVVALTLGCSWRQNNKPSVLIIAVESYGAEQGICRDTEDVQVSGLRTFCAESVRFTHAYTPSTLSQPAMASLLTAQYPFAHGVRDNGARPLSGAIKSVAENFVFSGYRTAFFSGGPPMWSYSGLSQGFEWFADHYSPSPGHLYQPAQEVSEQFLRWLDDSVGSRPFFSVLYFADLQFPQIETKTSQGEIRERSYTGQLNEIDETLVELVAGLKARERWLGTNIVLTGLNGEGGAPSGATEAELRGLNLQSARTQVALFIKPAGKKRDLPIQWKIDKNVSLVDVGLTLKSWAGARGLEHQPPIETVSLDSVLREPTADWRSERLILTESAWAPWVGLGTIRWGVRRGHWLFIFDQNLRGYNSLVDHFEQTPLAESDPQVRVWTAEISQYFASQGWAPWSGLPDWERDKWLWASEAWSDSTDKHRHRLWLDHLLARRADDELLRQWKVNELLREREWQGLATLGDRHQNTVWSFFANRGRSDTASSPQAEKCLSLLSELQQKNFSVSAKDCDDRLFAAFLFWVARRKQDEPEHEALQRLLQLYRWQQTDVEVERGNLARNLTWGHPTDTMVAPRLTDFALALPELAREREILFRELENF